MTVIEELLPGFRAELLARGAVPFDSGRMPWLGEYGWLDTDLSGYEVLSATRPLMDAVTRERVVGPCRRVQSPRPGDGHRARARSAGRQTGSRTGTETGRAVAEPAGDRRLGPDSRLARWLADVGLSSRRSKRSTRTSATPAVSTGSADRSPSAAGVMIFGTTDSGTAGLAVPVEDGQWLITGAGFGDRRPPRDAGRLRAVPRRAA